MSIRHDYDIKYSNQNLYWGSKPHSLVVELAKHLEKDSTVLDLGCGEGQNAVYLSKKGFRVTAVDISEKGLEKVGVMAKKHHVNVVTENTDVVSYLSKDKKFDAIICMNILQFIPADKIKKVIKRIKTLTRGDGYNAIASFITPDVDIKQTAIAKGRYIFDQGELKQYYKDWEIIKSQEKWSSWETHGEPKHRHFIVNLITKKCKQIKVSLSKGESKRNH